MTTVLAAGTQIDITPPVGTELAGWCFGASAGVADRLHARVLVLEDGTGPVVIVTLDLIGLGTAYADRLRADLSRILATPFERVLVSCSHTHSGPAAMHLRRWGTVDPNYVDTMLSDVTAMAVKAYGRLEPATISFGETVVSGICDNRRGDRGNVVDESLPVVAVRKSGGEPIAILYNYSCHPVAAHNDRNLISADFPGYAAQTISEAFPGVVPMFTLGAAGDVNPVEFHKIDLARSYGGAIGDAVVDLVRAGGTSPDSADRGPALDAVARVIELPVAPLPDAEWLRAERERWSQEAERFRKDGGPHSKVEDALIKAGWAEETLGVVEDGSALDHLKMEITALRVGNIVFVATPGELFVDIGLNVKEFSPFPHTVVVELANGSIAYLPTTEAYERGGYETEFSAKVYGLYMLTDRTQPIIEQAAQELLSELAARQTHIQEE